MSRFARQRDRNEKQIVEALRGAGASVQALDGSGVPDLLVGIGGRTLLVEVKNPDAKGGGKYNTGEGELTERQVTWWKSWKGTPIVVVHTIAEALAALGAITA